MSLLLFSMWVVLNGQSGTGSNYATIAGVVYEAGAGKTPLSYATVSLKPSGSYTTTDLSGKFSFEKLDPGKVSLSIQFIGMESIDTTLTLLAGSLTRLEFNMKTADFRLEEVVVTATQNKAGEATSSTISRQAMDHLQASTLSDIMQLLPGSSISNPSMSNHNTITLRSLTGSNANAFGTAIIVDGAQISNNASMQVVNPSISSTTLVGMTGSYAGGGIDTRSLSLDNIESIEVIRGVPSAEYGDLSSGAVIIRSKAGKEPLRIRFKTNPQLYEASVSKGFLLGEKMGSLHLSGDYSYSNKSATESYQFYQRVTAKALWSKTFGKNLRTNTSLDIFMGKDTRKLNPDDLRARRASSARDLGLRFNTNGILTINKGWLKNIDYTLNGGYTDQYSWEEELLGTATASHSINMINGSIISNIPGKKYYDIDGKEITNILPGSEKAWSTLLPDSYFSHYDIYGKPLDVAAKVKMTLYKSWGKINNQIIFGVDFKTEGNLGKGLVYDEKNPPYRPVSNKDASFRPRAFKDVPFINQFSFYIQDTYRHSFGRHDLILSLGGRYDNINGKSVITPRFNGSIDLIPEILSLKGAYGIAAKAPSALYLYPQDVYFDYILLNNMTAENEDERFVITQTLVFDAHNPDLKIQTRRTAEVGFDLVIAKKYRLSISGYDALMNNGYTFGMNLDSFNLVPFTQYKLNSWNDGTPEIEKIGTSSIFAMYSKPTNNSYEHVKGIEYELDFGRIEAIRTSFLINGTYAKSETRTSGYSYSTKENLNSLERHIGVYEENLSTYHRDLFNTSVRITHNIPKIGFVVSLSTHITWKQNVWSEIGNDEAPKYYISYEDGKMHNYEDWMKTDPNYSYLIESRASNRRDVEKYRKTIFFNLNLSKEIGDFLTASFYANNMFYYRPLHNSTKNPGSMSELGSQLFFGFDLRINIK